MSRAQQVASGQRIENEQLKALLTWNIADRKRRLAAATHQVSLAGRLKRRFLRIADPRARLDAPSRDALGVLERHIGAEGVALLYGLPFSTLDRRALAEIMNSAFWRNVLLPLDGSAEVPALFDTEFYLREYADVSGQYLPPLGHYVLIGAGEGRDPHPLFDTGWYLSSNPDVASSGQNPLFHFANYGGFEGRNPHPSVRADWYQTTYGTQLDNPYSRLRREQSANRGRRYRVADISTRQATAAKQKRPIICISHVFPSRPSAGNQYRIARILDWLAARGHELLVVVAPQELDEPDPAQQDEFFEKYRNAMICFRDGRLLVSVSTLDVSLASIDGCLIDHVVGTRRGHEQLLESVHELERSFCHEPLIGALASIDKQVRDPIYYINYAFMTRFLQFLPDTSLAFVDTHDILSHKQQKVGAFGVQSDMVVSADEERRMLGQAGAVLAIHGDDACDLAGIADGKTILTVGVDFHAADVGPPSHHPVILFVANNNMMNARGVSDFLRFAWPSIKAAVTDVRLVVVGSIAESVRYQDPQVCLAGIVEEIEPYYREARVVINPSVAGTGLKIKTVESIAFLRPIVTFPAGVEGISPSLLNICYVAQNWFEFTENVIDVLSSQNRVAIAPDDRDRISHHFHADTVYKELDLWLARLDTAAIA